MEKKNENLISEAKSGFRFSETKASESFTLRGLRKGEKREEATKIKEFVCEMCSY